MLGETLPRNLTGRREECERNRKIEPGALLLQLGRREVDGRLVAGPVELRGLDPAAHALLRLLAGAVDEPHQRERRYSALDVRLHLDAARLEADTGERDCARE